MSEMNIAFRTDAISQIVTGCFMRCLTLADSLKRTGAQIRFVSRNLPSYLCNMLAAKGVELFSLASDTSTTIVGGLAHSDWLGVSQEQDAQATIHALSDCVWDWLVVDQYALDAYWETALRGTARHIMVIDDIADRQHDCDVLLDQNYYADMQERYVGKVPAHCQLLLGPRYALLRDEFREMREKVKPRTGAVKRILVFFGGVDAGNYTGIAINALVELVLKDIQVDVVIGTQHPCRVEIEADCAEHGYVCHVQTSRMAELIANADSAIGDGGNATLEHSCLGLPALLVAMADNQIDIARALDLDGACLYLGQFEEVTGISKSRHIAKALGMQNQVVMISRMESSLVDGLDVDRIYHELDC